MKTEKIEEAIMLVHQIAEAGLAKKGLKYDALEFLDIVHAARAELAALDAENARLVEALASKQEERAFGGLYTLGDSEETGRKEEKLAAVAKEAVRRKNEDESD